MYCLYGWGKSESANQCSCLVSQEQKFTGAEELRVPQDGNDASPQEPGHGVRVKPSSNAEVL
jgi:hypothetical protein